MKLNGTGQMMGGKYGPVRGLNLYILIAAFNHERNETFDSFVGSWNVPEAPPRWYGGVIYIFMGNWLISKDLITKVFKTPTGFHYLMALVLLPTTTLFNLFCNTEEIASMEEESTGDFQLGTSLAIQE